MEVAVVSKERSGYCTEVNKKPMKKRMLILHARDICNARSLALISDSCEADAICEAASDGGSCDSTRSTCSLRTCQSAVDLAVPPAASAISESGHIKLVGNIAVTAHSSEIPLMGENSSSDPHSNSRNEISRHSPSDVVNTYSLSSHSHSNLDSKSNNDDYSQTSPPAMSSSTAAFITRPQTYERPVVFPHPDVVTSTRPKLLR